MAALSVWGPPVAAQEVRTLKKFLDASLSEEILEIDEDSK